MATMAQVACNASAQGALHAGAATSYDSKCSCMLTSTYIRNRQSGLPSASRTQQQSRRRPGRHCVLVSAGKAAGPEPGDGPGSSAALREQVRGLSACCCYQCAKLLHLWHARLGRRSTPCCNAFICRRGGWTRCSTSPAPSRRRWTATAAAQRLTRVPRPRQAPGRCRTCRCGACSGPRCPAHRCLNFIV